MLKANSNFLNALPRKNNPYSHYFIFYVYLENQSDPKVIKYLLNFIFECFDWICIKKIYFNIDGENCNWDYKSTISYEQWLENIFKSFLQFEENYILSIPQIEFECKIENTENFISELDFGMIDISFDSNELILGCGFCIDFFDISTPSSEYTRFLEKSDIEHNRILLKTSILKMRKSENFKFKITSSENLTKFLEE